MDSGSWLASLAESEAMETGCEPYSNRSLEALASDEVHRLIERLQTLCPGVEGPAHFAQQAVAKPFLEVLRETGVQAPPPTP